VLTEGGFDSVLALSDDGARFRARDHCLDACAKSGVAYARWQPWPDVEVRTWLIAADSWHVRVHYLKTSRALWSAESGFAVGYKNAAQVKVESVAPGAITVQSVTGGSGVRDFAARRTGECIILEPNSNLASSLTAMPILRGKHQSGEEWLVCVVGGWLGPGEDFARESSSFSTKIQGGRLSVLRDGKQIWSIAMTGQESGPSK
jgi:hypothetical protein